MAPKSIMKIANKNTWNTSKRRYVFGPYIPVYRLNAGMYPAHILHKNRVFSLNISLVNVSKSLVSCGFVFIY